MSTKALERHLAPLAPLLEMDGLTEICINQPQAIFIEKLGKFMGYPVPELSHGFLVSLAALIAEFNHKDFPAPLLSGSLPTGERVQFVMHPACEKNKVVCSIRRQHRQEMQLEDYEANGAFTDLIVNGGEMQETDIQLKKLYHNNDIQGFIKAAIQARKNILISGGTGTGKTTFLNACLKCIPDTERLITVEDTREVNVSQPNVAHLLFNEENEATTSLNIFKASLRLRPDRIFLSELRGREVWPYLRAANSGHPGSLSTVHADTPACSYL
jgi:type IV secretion system protein VirB11